MHLLPDIDGDGLADLAIAATYNESSHGSVWIVLSSQSDDLVSGLFDDTNHRLELVGPDESAQLGVDLGSADVDGDGLSDLLVSSISSTDPDDTGTVYVVFARDLPSTQTQMDIRSLASITFTGASPGAGAGTSVAGVGDLDGDGDDEFVVVAPGENDGAGVVYLVPGFYEVNGEHVLGDELSSATSPNATGTLVFAGAEGDALNDAVLAGDLNNDGHPDLAIGAPGHNGSGAVYVVYGGPDHWGDWWDSSTGAPQEPIQLDESALNEEHTARIYSEQGWEGFGSDVEGATDLNNDGIDDLLVGNSGSESMVRVFHGGGS